jgi:hypothetical protein
MRKAFFAGYEKKYGIRVVETSPADFGKLRAMVDAKNVEWDITEIGGQDAIRATKLDLVEKIDDKIVDRSKYPEKVRTPYVFASSVYTTIIGYRTDVFKGGTHPKSWADWWDVKKFPGARSMRNHPTDNLEFALIADGVPKDKVYPIDFDRAFTLGAGTGAEVALTIPESVFMLDQLTFAIITPAVITGAFADRMRFSALLVLMTLWSLVVYAPIAHWAWAPLGWLNQLGMADFAGGTVVEVNSGVAGLVCALVLGRRLGYGHDNMAPYNLAYAVVGASLAWDRMLVLLLVSAAIIFVAGVCIRVIEARIAARS